MQKTDTSYQDVLGFWFEETTPQQWFTEDETFDQEIREQFLTTFHQVVAGETVDWREKAEGRLAEIIVLDQFSRNMFRGTPDAFAQDELALHLAKEARGIGADKEVVGDKRQFFYMPYMHSESPAVHQTAIWLFLSLPVQKWWRWIKYEYKHKQIIDRFGRYPHRNEVLGRTSTPEELEFLKENPGF